jgi:hypothetical protein
VNDGLVREDNASWCTSDDLVTAVEALHREHGSDVLAHHASDVSGCITQCMDMQCLINSLVEVKLQEPGSDGSYTYDRACDESCIGEPTLMAVTYGVVGNDKAWAKIINVDDSHWVVVFIYNLKGRKGFGTFDGAYPATNSFKDAIAPLRDLCNAHDGWTDEIGLGRVTDGDNPAWQLQNDKPLPRDSRSKAKSARQHQGGTLFQCGIWALAIYEWFIIYIKDNYVAEMSFTDFFHHRCLTAVLATSDSIGPQLYIREQRERYRREVIKLHMEKAAAAAAAKAGDKPIPTGAHGMAAKARNPTRGKIPRTRDSTNPGFASAVHL